MTTQAKMDLCRTPAIVPCRRSSAVLLSLVIYAAVALNAAADGGGATDAIAHRGGLRAHRSSNKEMAHKSDLVVTTHERKLSDRGPFDTLNTDKLSEQEVNILAASFDASNLIPKIPSSPRSDGAKDTIPAEEDTAITTTKHQSSGDIDGAVPEKYIVGGSRANTADYPFFAQMRGCDNGDYSCNNGGSNSRFEWGGCGATLISSRHILTAGHCVTPNVQWEFDLRGFRIGGSEWATATWENVDMHPRYDENDWDMPEFDAAIVTLDRDVTSTPAYVDTGSIHDTLIYQTPIYTAIGHGKTEYGQPSSTLLEADMFGLEDYRCTQQYGYSYHTSDESMLCAGQFNYNQAETSTCNGDSGGPLLSMSGGPGINEPVLVGVTSWGPNSCAGGMEEPSVFAKVGTMVEWFGPMVCNSFRYEEDQPDWCRVCDGTNSGWCGEVHEAYSRVPTTTTTTTTAAPTLPSSSSSTTATTTVAPSHPSSSSAAPSQSSSSTTAAPQMPSAGSNNLGPSTDYTQACRDERSNKFCNYDNSNKPFCSCRWLADMTGQIGANYRREQCASNDKIFDACPNTCQERCGW